MDVIKLKSAVLDRFTEAEFLEFCLDHRKLRIERYSDGTITIQQPAFTLIGMLNAEVSYQVAQWNRNSKAGITFDSSAGFTLPKRVMFSPDSSWIAQARWNALSPDDRRGFARICPDFVVELLSPTDRLTDTMRKMEHWLEAGARLGWLIAPTTESVYLFEPGQPVRPVVGFDQDLVAGPLLPGFVLELRRLRMQLL